MFQDWFKRVAQTIDAPTLADCKEPTEPVLCEDNTVKKPLPDGLHALHQLIIDNIQELSTVMEQGMSERSVELEQRAIFLSNLKEVWCRTHFPEIPDDSTVYFRKGWILEWVPVRRTLGANVKVPYQHAKESFVVEIHQKEVENAKPTVIH